MLGNSRSLLHLGGELLIMGAGAWGLYLRLVLGGSPVPTTSWFGPLGLLNPGKAIPQPRHCSEYRTLGREVLTAPGSREGSPP